MTGAVPSRTPSYDAIVVGAGHNGLVAANLLADAGWDVLVLEAAAVAGGAVRSDSTVTAPGYVTDLFSSFYPMTAASPVIARLDLERWGLRWSHAPTVLAHVRPSAPAAVLHRDVERTAAGLALEHAADGDAWRALAEEWDRYGTALLGALLSPFPPIRSGLRLGVAARRDLWDLARRLVLPVRTMASERFAGEAAALLLAGNALHADVTPESAPSGLLGWLLVGLGQTVGFPVPAGGSSAITDALIERFRSVGGTVQTGEPVHRIVVRGGRAEGVVTAAGTYRARHGVLAACDAQVLYGRLVAVEDLPAGFVARLSAFQRASSTVKVNYALSSPVPWTDDGARGAGTVHVADSLNELTTTSAQLTNELLPADPFLLIGQTTTADPTRSPAGTESLWIYTHVPQRVRGDAADVIDVGGAPGRGGDGGPDEGRLRGGALDAFVARMEARVERHAPGFRDAIVARHVQGPGDLEREDASLVGGDIGGGTSQLHQQLIFRPVPGLARAETPITGLYLASASAHPGGSVHGACGANAARAAITGRRVTAGRRGAIAAVAAGTAAAALLRRAGPGRGPSTAGPGTPPRTT